MQELQHVCLKSCNICVSNTVRYVPLIGAASWMQESTERSRGSGQLAFWRMEAWC